MLLSPAPRILWKARRIRLAALRCNAYQTRAQLQQRGTATETAIAQLRIERRQLALSLRDRIPGTAILRLKPGSAAIRARNSRSKARFLDMLRVSSSPARYPVTALLGVRHAEDSRSGTRRAAEVSVRASSA